jgi:hypothetical protein
VGAEPDAVEKAPNGPTFSPFEVAGKNNVGRSMIKQIVRTAVGTSLPREIVRFIEGFLREVGPLHVLRVSDVKIPNRLCEGPE